MPYDDPDTADPMTLHGVVVATGDDGAMRQMAECFVEEFVRSGVSAAGVLEMFKNRGFAGPLLAYQTLGEDVIQGIIDRQVSLRGHRSTEALRAPDTGGRISLPVLDSQEKINAIGL